MIISGSIPKSAILKNELKLEGPEDLSGQTPRQDILVRIQNHF